MTPAETIEWFEIVDELHIGEGLLQEPQQLPRRFGVAVQAFDEVLAAQNCGALVIGGWAVWRRGYAGRISRDIDVVLPSGQVQDVVNELIRCRFEILTSNRDYGPKLQHLSTGVEFDVLRSGFRLGSDERMAPTLVRSPLEMGAVAGRLAYVELPSLIEMLLGADRLRTDADVIHLLSVNRTRWQEITEHIAHLHSHYIERIEALIARVDELDER